MRSSTSSLLTLALAGALASGFVMGCSSGKIGNDSSEVREIGSIDLELEISDGVVINTVSYTITGNGESITGTIDVSQAGSLATASIGQIPAGAGYTIAMTATSADGTVTCLGSAVFNIVAGQTTNVPVSLQCRAADTTGNVEVGVTFNTCPVIGEFTAAPQVAGIGAAVELLAAASDVNGDTLSYSWSASPVGNSFADANAANTTFSCALGGDYELTLLVNDGECDSMRKVTISCVAEQCGNGELDAGEQCDDGNSATCDGCDASCRTEQCGNGRRECSEACDDGNVASGDGCSPTCGAEGCGNGNVDPGEECDPSVGPQTSCDADGCSSTCQSEACGNGSIECGEECDDGNLDDGDNCNADCTAPDLLNCCNECEDTVPSSVADPTCQQRREACTTPGCLAVLQCVHDTNCADPASNTFEFCYCGAIPSGNLLDCITGIVTPSGPCSAIIAENAKTAPSDPTPPAAVVAQRYVDPNFETGKAMSLIQCDVDNCASECFPYPAPSLTCQ